MGVFLRRNRFGLGTLRAIKSKMKEKTILTNDSDSIDLDDIVRSEFYKIFTWGNVRKLPKLGEVHNHPDLVSAAADKGKYRLLLESEIVKAMDWNNYINYIPTTKDVDEAKAWIRQGGTYILRPQFHHGANDFHVIKSSPDNINEALSKFDKYYKEGSYLSQYIKKDKEYRVFIMHKKVVFVIEKIVDNPDEYAWNVANGGRMVNVRWGNWDPVVVNAALLANYHDKLQYGAYDIMVSNGIAYVLEVNTSPKVEEEYWSSCIAKAFDYALENNIGLYGFGTPGIYFDGWGQSFWKTVIHPALWEREG